MQSNNHWSFFEVAKQEIDQDYFFEWIFRNYKSDDSIVSSCACELISFLICDAVPIEDIKNDDIEFSIREKYDKKVNDGEPDITLKLTKNKIFILFEDKINAKISSAQLRKYKEITEKSEKINGYNCFCCVFKNKKIVSEKERKICNTSNFRLIDIHDIEHILPKCSSNAIIKDFRKTKIEEKCVKSAVWFTNNVNNQLRDKLNHLNNFIFKGVKEKTLTFVFRELYLDIVITNFSSLTYKLCVRCDNVGIANAIYKKVGDSELFRRYKSKEYFLITKSKNNKLNNLDDNLVDLCNRATKELKNYLNGE